MPADFQINLAKDVTSSVNERLRFYNGMLIFLVICAAAMVLTAYFSSINLINYFSTRAEQNRLMETTVAISDVEMSDFKNPEDAYMELQVYSRRIAKLKQLLGARVQLLPVIHNLFVDLPDDILLQDLSANKSTMTFGLVMPPPSDMGGDQLVSQITGVWEKNEELMRLVSSVRPLGAQRRTIGSESLFFVEFECVMKK